MEEHIVKITGIEAVTHNVNRYTVEKPAGYKYVPGQATEICLNQPRWKDERRPFTFTSLNEWPALEFTIKRYPERNGVTGMLSQSRAGDELILHDVWGAIQYKGEGTFLAGGAGVTPFIAILRQLQKDGTLGNNRLLFSNRTADDIILRTEFEQMLGPRFINTLTKKTSPGFTMQPMNAAFLQAHITDWDQFFYLCGPDPMVESLQRTLQSLGAEKDRIVSEQF